MNFSYVYYFLSLILFSNHVNKTFSIQVPIIDITPLLDDNNSGAIEVTANLIGKACEDIGFFIIVGHKVDPSIVRNAWEATKLFFDQPLEEKLQYVKPQDVYPFGYTELGGEILGAGKAVESNTITSSSSTLPPDLKEMFSLGPKYMY